jgi:antitoxin (DNA-binding transcriptional repressor) of toxin-antitoxin stability system
MCYACDMPDHVSRHELHNHTADVLRRVQAGERLRIMVGRRPIAELVPLAVRIEWVPKQRAIEALLQTDSGLRNELADALSSRVDAL